MSHAPWQEKLEAVLTSGTKKLTFNWLQMPLVVSIINVDLFTPKFHAEIAGE